ncbi:MAG: LysR family transcriptional regulator [Gammaproteobacteria bacterium]|nr:MAG: LysR family transcriptional regulator [Gammaproteobacteria bacterium]
MQIFIKVVEQGGFSPAAIRLGLSRGTVSKAIAHLEAQLGVRLLHRTTRQVSLTEAGQIYYRNVRAILENIEASEAEITGFARRPYGHVRITAPLSLGERDLSEILAAFCRDNPEISLELQLTDRFVALVEEGVDLAVRIGLLEDSSLIAKKITETALGLYCSPEFLRRRGRLYTPEDLKPEDCLRYQNRNSGRYWTLTHPDGREHKVQVHGRVSSNNGEVLATMAACGLGVVMLPKFIAKDYMASGKLVEVLRPWSPGNVGVWAVYPTRQHVPLAVRHLIDYIAVHLPERLPEEDS